MHTTAIPTPNRPTARSGRRAPRRPRLVAVIALVAMTVAGCSGGRETASVSRQADLVPIGQNLTGPPGTEASIYAKGLEKVAAFAFDTQGRLWVATAEFEDKGTDAVYLVASAGATPVKVVEDVHTPLGLLWQADTLYVASKERVDAFGAFDGTSFADHRTVHEFDPGVGEVNGMAWSPAGRIMLGISAPCDSCTPEQEASGAVVSFLPDGTDLRVEAKGIRAPIALTYYPGTDDLFTTMNHRDDLGANTPGDWLGVVRRGQNWGFPACYGQGGTSCDGVPTPVAVLDPHAALSGVAIVTGQLGPAVGTAAVVAEWNEHKVQQVSLEKRATAYTGTVSPFVTGIDRPVAVISAPDGAVVIGDWATGIVYRIAAKGAPAATTASR